MNRLNKLSLSVLALIISLNGFQMITPNSSLEAAEVYSWVDNSGTKHYSDKPFKTAKKISFSVATPKKQKQKQKQETAAVKSELFDLNDEVRLSAECAKAKENVTNLLKGGKFVEKNAEGNDVELSIGQINAKLAASQAYQKRYCSKTVKKSESK